MSGIFKITAFICLLTSMCFGQEFPALLSNEHVQIKGTNLYLIPPSSFEQSENFKGLQNPEDQTMMIMTMEIPGPFLEVSGGFNAEVLETQGMILKDKSEINIAGYDGLYIEVDQPANGMVFSKEILIYGTTEFTVLVNGMHLKEDTEAKEAIKKSVLSTFVDKNTPLNPRENLTYTVEETAGSLQFHSVIGNAMLFNRDLKTPTESKDKATLVIDRSFAKVTIRDKKKFCISRVESYPEDFSVLEEKGVEPITIDTIDGYALYAMSNTNELEEMYQVVLFNEDGSYYIFVGTYITGSEIAENDIKKVIETFKTKE